MQAPRLMAVLAHPDDESLGVGGTLAKYASEGVEVFLLTATRGDGGRYRGYRSGDHEHPGPVALATIREAELRAAASVLGVREVSLLDYRDQHLDRADPRQAVAGIAGHLRRVRPDVVVTFGPDGAYGHPDHIAISQFTTAAIVAAADPGVCMRRRRGAVRPHAVSKLYYIAWPESTWAAYQAAFRKLFSTVDGVERQAMPWPDWAITTVIDTRDCLAHGVAGGLVPRVAGRRLRAVEGPVAGAPRGVVGPAVVLSRVQHRQRRTSARDGSLRRDPR